MLAVDARRFVCAMQELTNGHVWATEQVWHEVWGACVATSHRAAKRSVQSLLRRKALAEGIDSRALIVARSAANVAAMRQWLEQERDRNDRAWEFVPSPPSSQLLQLELLDSGALTDNKNRHKDALVIAEAALAGAHIIASDNLKTIRHGVLNAWLAERKAEGHPLLEQVQVPFVLDPDETAYAKCRHLARKDIGSQCLEWALAACRPNNPDLPVTRLQGIVRRFAANIQSAGFIAVGRAIVDALDDMSADEREFNLRHAGGTAERTRASEERRLAAIRERLSNAGG